MERRTRRNILMKRLKRQTDTIYRSCLVPDLNKSMVKKKIDLFETNRRSKSALCNRW